MDVLKREEAVLNILEMLNATEIMVSLAEKVDDTIHLKDFNKIKSNFYDIIIRDEEIMAKVIPNIIYPKLIKVTKKLSELLEFDKDHPLK